jgi:hypothetical protein
MKYSKCPECGEDIVRVEGTADPLPDRLEDMPHPSDLPPKVLVCANGHKIKARTDNLVLISSGRGLRVEFERAAAPVTPEQLDELKDALPKPHADFG